MIMAADQDFVTVSGVAPISTINSAIRTNVFLNTVAATDALNDEFKFTRYFSKSGTYKAKILTSNSSGGAIMDVGFDSPAGNNLFDGISLQSPSKEVETTISVSRGFHDISFLAEADGGASAFRLLIIFLQFDLIDEHPVLGESAPAKYHSQGTVLLAKHEAEKAESTFTFDLADVYNKKYSDFIVSMQGAATGALAIQMTINGLGGTAYFMDGRRIAAGVEAFIDTGGVAVITLATATMISSNNGFQIHARFKTTDEAKLVDDRILGYCEANSSVPSGEVIAILVNSTGQDPITQIVISTSISTWAVGTKIEIYGVKK